MQKLFDAHSSAEESDEDTLLDKLRDMKSSIAKHYDVGPSLAEQLAQAIASEQYELAAKLRDRLDQGPQN